MIDLHCHILPGVDDGAADLTESLDMAVQAVQDGIGTIVATPHTANGTFSNPSTVISDAVERFRDALAQERVAIKICPGVEAHLTNRMAERVSAGELMTLNDTGRYILVEFPFQTLPEGAEQELFQLKLMGVTPIIAHPERNLVFQVHPEKLRELVEMGCLTQLTAMSVTGELGESAMAFSHQLLERGLAHLIASDAHSAGTRGIRLSRAVDAAGQVLGDKSLARTMVTDSPRVILEGRDFHPPPPNPPKEKKRRFKFW